MVLANSDVTIRYAALYLGGVMARMIVMMEAMNMTVVGEMIRKQKMRFVVLPFCLFFDRVVMAGQLIF